MENPPKLQILHCRRARAPGGASLFSDGIAAALAVAASDPKQFTALTTFPVPYHYHRAGQIYQTIRPTIVKIGLPPYISKIRLASEMPAVSDQEESRNDGDIKQTITAGEISYLNYSPPFQAPLTSLPLPARRPQSVALYHAAVSAFSAKLSSPKSVFKLRLEEGDCAIFDNRRILHARSAFNSSLGDRWLSGAYLDDDVFCSRWCILRKQFTC